MVILGIDGFMASADHSHDFGVHYPIIDNVRRGAAIDWIHPACPCIKLLATDYRGKTFRMNCGESKV